MNSLKFLCSLETRSFEPFRRSPSSCPPQSRPRQHPRFRLGEAGPPSFRASRPSPPPCRPTSSPTRSIFFRAPSSVGIIQHAKRLTSLDRPLNELVLQIPTSTCSSTAYAASATMLTPGRILFTSERWCSRYREGSNMYFMY